MFQLFIFYAIYKKFKIENIQENLITTVPKLSRDSWFGKQTEGREVKKFKVRN
jgi:hypothetical protein